MHIAVCDDNILFLSTLKTQVEALDIADRISDYSDLNSFLRSVESGTRYDAVLMDIDWEQTTTGMDIAERLSRLSPMTRIIYVTGYNDRFSQQIFLQSANLSGYLVKPVDSALLRANLEKVADAARRDEPTLTVSVSGKPVSLPLGEIAYLESLGHTVSIHIRDEVITVYERLDRLSPMLPEGFLRCHKSFLVNMRHIRRFLERDILLDTGETIPVSRSRYAQAKTDYFRRMGRSF